MSELIRRHGAYVVFATTSLALAVGATLTVFTIVNALWLQPMPFPDADWLVTLVADSADTDTPIVQVGTFPRWKIFEAVAGQVVTSGGLGGLKPHLVLDDVGRGVETVAVTPQYFTLFGQSIRGRDFTRADDQLGAEPVAIISDRLWRRTFGARSDKSTGWWRPSRLRSASSASRQQGSMAFGAGNALTCGCRAILFSAWPQAPQRLDRTTSRR